MAPSAVVSRPNNSISVSTAPTASSESVQRFNTATPHGFLEGQVLRRFPSWALASADLEENCGEHIVLKTGPRFFDVAKYDGVYDFISGFTNNDRGKTIYLDWRPANIGKMTLEEPVGPVRRQVLGKVVDDGRILIRPELPTLTGTPLQRGTTEVVTVPNHTFAVKDFVRYVGGTTLWDFADGSDMSKLGNAIVLEVGGTGATRWMRLTSGPGRYELTHGWAYGSAGQLYSDPRTGQQGKLTQTRPNEVGQNIIFVGSVPTPNCFDFSILYRFDKVI